MMENLLNQYNNVEKSAVRRKINIKLCINVLLGLIVIVMPYILSKEKHAIFRMGKVKFIYVVAILILGLMIIAKDKIKYKQQKIALVFLAIILINSILSPYKSIAFFGNKDRNEGFFMIAMYIILYYAAANNYIFNKKVLSISIISADIMAIYGIFQTKGFDIARILFKIENMQNEAIGFIGHRNFFSTYLLIFLFISLGIYIYYGEKKFLFMSIPLFAGLISTLTRGGWVGFLAYAIAGVFTILKRKDALKRVGILLLLLITSFTSINYISDGAIIDRCQTIVEDTTDFSVDSGSYRVRIWQMGLKIIKNNPILGTGPDTFKYISKEICPLEVLDFIYVTDSVADKAHNEFIEYAVAGGLPTLALYILLLISIIKGLWKNRIRDEAKISLLFIIGYLVQSMFNISVIMVAPIFWIMLGITTRIANGERI